MISTVSTCIASKNQFSFTSQAKGYQKFGSRFKMNPHFQSRKYCETTSKSNEQFWQKVEKTPTLTKKGPIFFQGGQRFSSVAEANLEIFHKCTKSSEYVENFLLKEDEKGTVLDLGCGLGVNSIHLHEKGWKVIAIDKEPEIIERYSEISSFKCYAAFLNGVKTTVAVYKPNDQPKLITDDIVTCEYPKNVDAVIAVDVLNYVLPVHLKKTMNKIFQALRPGGKFIGTLFFKPDSEDANLIFKMYGEGGLHLYPGEKFTSEIVTRSGFKIKLMRVRDDRLPITPFCLEFLAERPA